MAAIGYIALFMLIALVTLFVIMVKHNKPVPPEEHDEREWYDENGNHIYYDRKLIRYLEQKVRKTDPCPQKLTEGSESLDESK